MTGGLVPLFSCATLEPPWKNNETGVSCIPEGLYKVKHRRSSKYGHHLILIDVVGREFILFHWGNYVKNTRGCIITGTKHQDINGDGIPDVSSSKKAFNKIMRIVKDETDITLKICYT